MLVVVAHRTPAERARMRAALEALDVEALEASGDVVACVRRRRPDVAVVDEPEAVRAIASDPDLLATSVVLVGGDESIDAALLALAAGAHDVLRDPPAPGELVARVRAAGRASALRSQLLAREATLEQLAFNDDLTGLWNRRFMQRRLSAALRTAERHERPLSVALVDVDRFKEVNDGHGHAAGDAVLVAVAGRLREVLREEDVIGRWGGDEFLVVLPDEPVEGAVAAGDRIRAHVAAREVDTPHGAVAVTVSVGCGGFQAGDDADAVLRRADEALYDAKRAGRNAVAADG